MAILRVDRNPSAGGITAKQIALFALGLDAHLDSQVVPGQHRPGAVMVNR